MSSRALGAYDNMNALNSIPALRAALYLRLSKDDDEKEGDSVSIQMQRTMLEQYCETQGWEIVAIYIEACDIIEPTRRTQSYQGFQGLVNLLGNYITQPGLMLRHLKHQT